MEIFQLEQVSFQYPKGNKPALENINLSIGTGEFIVLCGNSGSGKTTLLRQLKPAAAPHGQRGGRILFHGTLLSHVPEQEQAEQLGFVSQNPEDQLVTDKVWHELAFGLESLGMDNRTIGKRVAEMSHFFGIQEWFHKDTSELSGGQKQLLNLAAIMVMQPEVLLLDEPVSQLDPIAALDFVNILHRIHRELGTTIVMTEHQPELVLPYCTRLMVLEQGRLELDGFPREIMEKMRRRGMKLFSAMPASVRIWNAVEDRNGICPLTVQEGREWFTGFCESHRVLPMQEQNTSYGKKKDCAVELKDIWFRYEKKGKDILQGLSLSVRSGELLAILGGNGSGKTTILSIINKGQSPYQGKLRFPDGEKRIITLPQNPQLLFVESTVKKDLEVMIENGDGRRTHDSIASVMEVCKLDKLLDRHPYDLSGGEQQRLALAKVLLARPEILLLDEPTKGLDIEYKTEFAGILGELTRQGITIIMVSHDVEFCAEYADRCAMVFDGKLVAEDMPRRFFSENHFYTTSTNRMVRHLLPMAVTVEDVIRACGGEGEDNSIGKAAFGRNEGGISASEQDTEEKPVSGKVMEVQSIAAEEKQPEPSKVSENSGPLGNIKEFRAGFSVSKLLGIFMFFLAIPLTIVTGVYLFQDQKYLFISLFILLECMLPFFWAYENRKPAARDLVMLSVLCGMGVAGRVVFSALAQVKPVTAITIIAGAAFGGETGFLTGALTMLVSNMIFGQGPWTPWQMFAMGLIGFGSGLLFYGKDKKPSLVLLCIYGVTTPVLLYGGIMNPASAIMAGIALDWKIMVVYWLSGLPLDLIHGITTGLFLLLGARPILQKLERVKIKFG